MYNKTIPGPTSFTYSVASANSNHKYIHFSLKHTAVSWIPEHYDNFQVGSANEPL